MKKPKIGSEWVAPIFIALALLAIWLVLYYLPSGTFGTQWATLKDDMWLYFPWLLVFALGLYTLKRLVTKR